MPPLMAPTQPAWKEPSAHEESAVEATGAPAAPTGEKE